MNGISDRIRRYRRACFFSLLFSCEDTVRRKLKTRKRSSPYPRYARTLIWEFPAFRSEE